MDSADEKEASEILRSLLNASRVQNQQITDANYWQQNDGNFQPQEHIVWQIDQNEVNKRPVINDNRSIIHHIPVTYLTAEPPNITFSNAKTTDKPVTYVLSQNIITDNLRYQKPKEDSNIILTEQQKIVLIQELDQKLGTENVYNDMGNTVNIMETRVFRVNGCSDEQAAFPIGEPEDPSKNDPKYQVIDIENINLHSNDLTNDNNLIDSDSGDETTVIAVLDSDVEKVMKRKNIQEGKKVTKVKKTEKNEDVVKLKKENSEITEKKKGVIKKKAGKKKIVKKKKPNAKIKNKKVKKPGKVMKKDKKVTSKKEESENEEKGEESSKFKGSHNELTKLEDNAEQVAERFKIGCECSEWNCFEGLNAEKVFRHRLNIADLTKAEHDMYLMGVIMASMQNPDETCRHKERIRIRSSYAYQGKKVCLTAFLYLEHVTLYQMKRIRKHLKYHGVSPRIHGNHGRKPANTLSLDIYQHATNFVQNYIEKHSVKSVPNFTTLTSNKIGNAFTSGTNLNANGKKPKKIKIANKMTSYHLPADCTKKTVHDEYKAYCEGVMPDQKVMQYSTFTSFLKKQFPNVKFQKVEKVVSERWNSAVEIKIPVQAEESDSRKAKKPKKILELFETATTATTADNQPPSKSIQTQQIYVPNKTIQISQQPPPPLILTAKQNPQKVYNKNQVSSGPVMKTSQIVLNGSHLQFCSNPSQLQSDVRLQNQVLVGNQIMGAHCVSQTPSYGEHVYTMHNVNES